ncbi:hypothetical protein MKZ38_009081 [Zalerion maritima]|uniref:Uncharacterized protein n=1 Tax=Zalerion maritima TaxID=339359 RepID=A0AAD5WNB8_9PEZI|nr:hypothetical protein MKZ38_009081 [Zalerion maritima]
MRKPRTPVSSLLPEREPHPGQPRNTPHIASQTTFPIPSHIPKPPTASSHAPQHGRRLPDRRAPRGHTRLARVGTRLASPAHRSGYGAKNLAKAPAQLSLPENCRKLQLRPPDGHPLNIRVHERKIPAQHRMRPPGRRNIPPREGWVTEVPRPSCICSPAREVDKGS